MSRAFQAYISDNTIDTRALASNGLEIAFVSPPPILMRLRWHGFRRRHDDSRMPLVIIHGPFRVDCRAHADGLLPFSHLPRFRRREHAAAGLA